MAYPGELHLNLGRAARSGQKAFIRPGNGNTGLPASRKVDGKARAASLAAIGRDRSAMHLHELLGDTQSQTQSALAEAEIARGMAAGIELREERLEQVAKCLWFQADATIANLDVRAPVGGQPRIELDRASVGRELDGVGQQIDEHRAELVRVNHEPSQILVEVCAKMELANQDERADLVNHPFEELHKLDRAAL